jgi:hypothetical protein
LPWPCQHEAASNRDGSDGGVSEVRRIELIKGRRAAPPSCNLDDHHLVDRLKTSTSAVL